MKAIVTQFLRPNGRQEPIHVPLGPELEPKYTEIRSLGLRLTVEVLMTGEISMCVEDPERGDFDMEIVGGGPIQRASDNDPLPKLIARFDAEAYRQWVREYDDGDADP